MDAGAGGARRGRVGRPPGSVVVSDDDLRRVVEQHPEWSVSQIAKAVGLSESWTRQRLRGLGLVPGVGAGEAARELTDERQEPSSSRPAEEAPADPLVDRVRLLVRDELDPLVQALRVQPSPDDALEVPARPAGGGQRSAWPLVMVVAAVLMAGMTIFVYIRQQRPEQQASQAASVPVPLWPWTSTRSRFPRAA